MESRNYVLPLLVILVGFLLTSQAYNFYVGGKDGWVVKPSEGYVQWSQRNRFQISDSLVFKYNKETDSVLVVSKEDFDTCGVSNPILKMEGGDSSYKFARSGKFYFITGNQSNCQAGQKLATVVITPRTPRSPPNATPPSPSSTAPSGSPAGTAPPTAPVSSPPTPTRSHGMTPPGSPSTSPPAPATTVPSGGPSIAPMSPPSMVPSNAPTNLSPEESPFASPPSPPGFSPSMSPTTAPSLSPGGVPSLSPGGVPSAIPGGDMAPAGGPSGSGASIAPKAQSSAPAIISLNKVVLGLCLFVTVALGRSVLSV